MSDNDIFENIFSIIDSDFSLYSVSIDKDKISSVDKFDLSNSLIVLSNSLRDRMLKNASYLNN